MKSGIQITGQIILLTLFSVAGCNSSGGSDNASSGGVEGVAQKGPFRAGGEAVAVRLNEDGSLSNQEVSGSIDDRGRYVLAELPWSGPTQIQMQGEFFDESTANFSSEERTLVAFTRVGQDGQPTTNVNLFTYFVAERTRFLMASDNGFGEALAQARDDAKAALFLTRNPAELNLLEDTSDAESDSASLLAFSVASLAEGMGQTDIDNMAADFADDGEFNGIGAEALDAINGAADDDLLSDARLALQNQYSVTPPRGSGNSFAWLLDKCTAAKINESRVLCQGAPFYGNHADDNNEFVTFIPPLSGHYTIEMFADPNVDNANINTCSWALYTDANSGSTEVGHSRHTDGFCGVEDVTTFRLSAGRAYYLRPVASQDDEDGPVARFRLSATRVTDGRESTNSARKLPLNETVPGVVGTLTSSTTDSYYRFTSAGGMHTITVSGFPCGSGGAMRLELYENGFNSRLARDWEEGKCSQTVFASLEPLREYYIKIDNWLGGFHRDSFRPEPSAISFEIEISTD